ncbi:MAG: MFS transporter [Desulfobacteraceae bacterium]|nr:MFS transporter [Desulfobacteraceae bacterium]
MSREKFKIILYCWLIYGFFYLNRLNLSPVIPLIMSDLEISHARIGLIGASFYAFYTMIQLPAGYLSDLFGARKILFAGGLISAFSNIIFSVGSGLWHLIPSQCLNGLGQGCGFSPIIKIIDQHFPFSQRGRVLGLVMTSTAVFNVAVFFLAGYIGQTFGWRAVFWSAPLVFIPVLFLFKTKMRIPSLDIPLKEALTEPSAPETIKLKSFIRTNSLVFSRELCLLGLGFFSLCYITYSNLIWLPSFIFESYHVSLVQASFIAALYPLSGFVSRPLGGYISDVIFKGKRKQTILIGLFAILVSTLLLARIEDFHINIYFIILIGFFDNLIGPLFFAWMLDLVPNNRSGSGAGALQFFGHTGTILSIYFSGIIVDVFQSYRPFFMILCGISILGTISVCLISERGEKKI